MKTKQEIVENWLPRYTERPLEAFTNHILLTNFTKYVELFAERFQVPILGLKGSMPNASADGITIINFGMGSANAATIMDLLTAIMPHAVLFLGKCGGLKVDNQLGDYLIPIAAIRGEGTSNEYLPPDPITFIQNICKNKPDWWVRRYTQGSFSYAEGLVYPNAMSCIVDSFEIPKTWVRLIAFDYGLSDDARYLFGAIDMQKGILYIYKELSANNKNIEQLAQLYYQGAEDIPSGMLYGQPIIDPKSGPKRDYNKKSLSDYFLDYGIAFKPGVVSLDARIFRLNTYIDQGYVKIFRDCRLLIKELSDFLAPFSSY